MKKVENLRKKSMKKTDSNKICTQNVNVIIYGKSLLNSKCYSAFLPVILPNHIRFLS